MAARMSYQDPIRIAQLKLAGLDGASGGAAANPADDVRRFRIDELIGVLPAIVTGDAHLVEFLESSLRLRIGETRGRLHAASANLDRTTFDRVEQPRAQRGHSSLK